MTKVLGKTNEGGNSKISFMIGGPSGACGVGRRGRGRGSSHGNDQSMERRNMYSGTLQVRQVDLN